MDGLYKCSTCHWISRDGRCFNNSSPHGLNRDQMPASGSCFKYQMDFDLKRRLEEQERERKNR